VSADDEQPVRYFTRGTHRFEVYRSLTERGVSYVGYFNGQPSVAASERRLVAQMLLRRHFARRR
jgi:hypothetical protein